MRVTNPESHSKTQRNITITIVALILLSGNAVCSDPADSVLTVLVNFQVAGSQVNRVALGSGSFISSDGTVLTCYHVVVGAKSIQVFHQFNLYSASVERISPDHDLAILKVVGLRSSVPYIELRSSPAADQRDAQTFVYGNVAGLSGSRLAATVTSSGFVRSGEMRTPATFKRLFVPNDMDLIPLQTTIYNGVSGGPVVEDGKLVGVVSGSLGEGGSIAWGIPIKYLNGMTEVHKRADQIVWPDLALMESANWTNLRRQVGITDNLAKALDSYLGALQDYSTSLRTLQTDFTAMADFIAKAVAEFAAFPSTSPNSADDHEALLARLTQIQDRANEMDQTITAHYESEERNKRRFSATIQKLNEEEISFERNLPDTERNYQIISNVSNLTSEKSQVAAVLPILISEKINIDYMHLDLSTMPNITKSLEKLREVLAQLSSPEAGAALEESVENLRSMGPIVQQLLGADLLGSSAGARPSLNRWISLDLQEGIKDLQEVEAKAVSGDREAQWSLGALYCYGGGGIHQDIAMSVFWLIRAAEQGHVQSMLVLAKIYKDGGSLGQDIAKSTLWLRKAADLRFPLAEAWLADAYVSGQGVDKDPVQAFTWYSKAAKDESASGEIGLGDLYRDGLGVKPDYREALKHYEIAKEKESASAFVRLGWMYESGLGGEKRYDKAFDFYMQGALRGDDNAENNLGRFYENGVGSISRDCARAAMWYIAAATAQNTLAMTNLSFLNTEGCTAMHQLHLGARLLQAQAETGSPAAQFGYAMMLQQGQGAAAPDLEASVNWMRKAAEQGYAAAETGLALQIFSGTGVKKDNVEGVHWLSKAADQRQPLAMYFLGKAYLYGEFDLTIDPERGLALLNAAAKEGSPAAIHLLETIRGQN